MTRGLADAQISAEALAWRLHCNHRLRSDIRQAHTASRE